MSPVAPRAVSRPLAILLSLLLAVAALLAVPVPALAGPGDVTGGTATWGVDAGYRATFGTRAATGGASIAAGDLPTWPVDAAASSWDPVTRTGVLQLIGSIRLGYFAGPPIPGTTPGNYVYLSNPTITLSGDVGTISASSAGSSHDLLAELPTAPLAGRTIATLDLRGVDPVDAAGSLSWAAVPVAIAAGGAEVLAHYVAATDAAPTTRAVGSALDPISFSITREAPLTATATTLALAPAAGAVAGSDVTLTATVAPPTAGTVQFLAGGSPLGDPVVAAGGVATLTTAGLAVGTTALSARFTPSDPGFADSTSGATDYLVVAAPPAVGAAWGISGYLNAATGGRPNPSPTHYSGGATFDAVTRVSTWGSPRVTPNADGTVTLAFSGTTVNHARTGGGWMRLADLEATLDRQGNGVVTGVVSYGSIAGTPGNIPFDPDAAALRGPQRVALVTLAGNATAPVAVPGGATWSGLAGSWADEFISFLGGGGEAAAWAYASTVTNTGTADRRPSTFAFTLPSVPEFVQYTTDAAWGISGYLNAATGGRPNPSPAHYGPSTTLDATTRVTTFSAGTVVSNPDRTVTISYPGSTVNHARTGGGYLRLADLRVTVDESGNGTVSAVVSYGTVPGTPGNIPYDPAHVAAHGPERVDLVTLTGNDADLLVRPAGASFTALAGVWTDEFLAFLAGDPAASPSVPAWAYASTVTNTGTADRRPAPLTLRFATAPVFTGTAGGGEQPGGPTEQPQSPAATPAPGTLTWGVKASFRQYVLSPVAHGSITTSGGAGAVGGGYWFPQSGSSLSSAGTGSVSYRGTVAFTGHGGILSVRLSDPVVRVANSTTGVLSVVTAGGRVDLATLDLAAGARRVATDGAVSYTAVPATLTAAGAAGFAGFYAAGESLDPVSFTIGSANPESGLSSTRGGAAAAAHSPDPTPPATEGVSSPATTFTAGGQATFTADGFQPGESGILAVVYSDPVVLADDLTADAAGAVTWTGPLPTGLTGRHTFTFQGSVDRGLVIEIAPAEVAGCRVAGAELSWGFKESFRAYLDGAIANGGWATADGATYATPLFTWAAGAGGYDTATGDADLAFAGSVRFTGHGGVLDTTIASPRIVIDGDRAVLLLDVSGTTRDGSPVSAVGVEFAELDLAAAERLGGGDLVAFTGIPAVLTEAGAAAFGTYEAGSPLDPVDLSINVDPACAQPAGVVEPAAAEGERAEDGPPLPWLVAGGVALALLAVLAAAVLLARRARRTA